MKTFLKKYKLSSFFLMIISFFLVASCSERENYDENLPTSLNIIESMKIGETAATIDHLSGVINFVLPPETDITNLQLDITAPEGVEINPSSGTIVDLSSPLEATATFGGHTRNYIINARVLPSQIAFVNEAATIAEIADDDVKAAALWAQSVYGSKFVYIPFSNLTMQSLADVNVLFFYYDQVGSSALPQEAIDKKGVVTQFIVEGGKMLVGGMATSYIAEIGRDNSGLLTIRGNGPGFVNMDTWGIDGGVNFQNDQRVHPIYNQTTVISTDSNGYFPIINGGFKEDHNNLWDLAPLLAPGHQSGQFAEFERLYGGKVLAVWSGVSDECCPGIIEFKPTSVFTGSIIAIGVGGMEWAMNDGRINIYDTNMRGIYRNAIDYLRTR